MYRDDDNSEYTVATRADGFALVATNRTRTEAIPMLGGGHCFYEQHVFELRKNGVLVADGAGSWTGENLTYFAVPGTEAMLRGILDDMMAERDRAIEAERLERQRRDEMKRLERQRRERIAAAAALGITLEESA